VRSAPFQKYRDKDPAKLPIAEFGVEADAVDRREAQATVVAYLQATGAGEWSEACGYISAVLRSQIDEIIKQQSPPKPGCDVVLHALATPPGKQRSGTPIYAPEGIASMRIKEGPGGGFALFHSGEGDDYWIAVKREGNSWRILSAAPQPFG